MANHPNRRRYRVSHIPGASDDENEAWFSVRGPRVNEFAVCNEFARAIQRWLNSPYLNLTPREWRVIKDALAFAEAGEGPDEWTAQDFDAARRLLAKI